MRIVTRSAGLTLLLAVLAVVAPFAAAGEAAAPPACASTPASFLATQPDAGFVFEGCWAWFPIGPCYDVYRDSTGGYWICRQCGTTTKPGSGQCSRITLQTLNTGWWCS
jgi:hypothetical protein